MGHLKNIRIYCIALIAFFLVFIFPLSSLAKEKKKDDEQQDDFEVPSHVLSISKENTFPNSTEEQEIVEPSKTTKKLIEGADTEIQNPELIKMLNESSIKPSPIGFGYRGMVYLRRSPLHYKALETTVTGAYKTVNTNESKNVRVDDAKQMSYLREDEKAVTGPLTNKIKNP